MRPGSGLCSARPANLATAPRHDRVRGYGARPARQASRSADAAPGWPGVARGCPAVRLRSERTDHRRTGFGRCSATSGVPGHWVARSETPRGNDRHFPGAWHVPPPRAPVAGRRGRCRRRTLQGSFRCWWARRTRSCSGHPTATGPLAGAGPRCPSPAASMAMRARASTSAKASSARRRRWRSCTSLRARRTALGSSGRFFFST